MNRHARKALLLFALVGILGCASASSAWAARSASEDVVAPAGTTQAWIDLENSGDVASLVTLSAGPPGSTTHLDLLPTTFGAGAVLEADAGPFTVSAEAATETAVSAVLSLTFADDRGLILQAYQTSLELQPTLPEPSPTDSSSEPNPTDTPDPTATTIPDPPTQALTGSTADPGGEAGPEDGSLVATGFHHWGVAVVAMALLTTGGLMAAVARKRALDGAR